MKKQKKKNLFKIYNKLIFSLIFSIGFGIGMLFAATLEQDIPAQSSTNTGSYNSEISFIDRAVGLAGTYVNEGENSSIIGDYFKGYYFDSVYGYFRLDWSTNKDKNVRFVGSTDKCSSGYGYRMDGKAKGIYAGFIDFGYDADTFVYYCTSDEKLYGKAYAENIGVQVFDGIGFQALTNVDSVIEFISSDVFVNDTTSINQITTFGGDEIKLDDTRESIFYIVK